MNDVDTGSLDRIGAKPDAQTNDPYGPYLPVVSLVLLAIGVVIVCLDVLFAKSVFDVLVNENETISWLLAFGVSLVGAASAICAGIATAEKRPKSAALLLMVWALIGVAMATVRCFKGSIVEDDVAAKDIVLALVMVGVYLGGVALYFHAREVWRPQHFAMMSARRAVRRAEQRRRTVEAVYCGVQHELSDVDNARPRICHELQTVLASIDAMQRQLHAVARDRLVLRLADPRQSSLFRSPIEPGGPLKRTHRDTP
jgi:hypothetical protein